MRNAQIGDRVKCLLAGKGKIDSVCANGIRVLFDSGEYGMYEPDGKLMSWHEHRSLFYIDSHDEIVSDRPETVIKVSQLPLDTPLKVATGTIMANVHYAGSWDSKGIYCWCDGTTSFTKVLKPDKWESAALGKNMRIGERWYKEGTKIEYEDAY